MDTSLIVVIMIVAIIIIAVVIYKVVSNGDKETGDTGTLHMPTSGPAVGGVARPVVSPGVYKPSSGKAASSSPHSVDRIYACVFPKDIWICAGCECENDFSSGSCCVCNRQRDWR